MRRQAISRAFCTTGAAVMLLATGCAEDSAVGSSNRGTGSGSPATATSIENAYIAPRFIPGRCSIQVGGQADLRFTVTNNRSSGIERLLEVSTQAAETVHYSPQAAIEIGPGTSVAFGQAGVKPVGAKAFSTPAVELEGLKADARPGTSVDVTFRFERFGDVDMRVPIEACRAQA